MALRYLANCSMLFTERPLLGRRAAGFDATEFWWPGANQPVPPDVRTDAFVRTVGEAGAPLVGLRASSPAPCRLRLRRRAIPQRSTQLGDNIDVAIGIGQQLGVSAST